MKAAIGQRPRQGAWGGGNRFAAALVEALEARGHQVRYDLEDPDVDLVLITDPRSRNPQQSFTVGRAWRYLAFRNPNAVAVHRINECDERKGARTMNFRLRLANRAADHTVFIGSWLEKLDVWRRGGSWSVILNGADDRVFNAVGAAAWDGAQPLRLVTHHWGGHAMKGFDVYRLLDRLLGEGRWREKLEFTYVGNLPDSQSFRHARHVPPLDGQELAAELKRHHVYLTASINEPAGMHHIEGALSGLPLLYRNSGALPEYCDGFGVAFDGPDDFEAALARMVRDYASWKSRMAAYANTAEKMANEYVDLFEDLVSRREAVKAARLSWLRQPFAFLLAQAPW